MLVPGIKGKKKGGKEKKAKLGYKRRRRDPWAKTILNVKSVVVNYSRCLASSLPLDYCYLASVSIPLLYNFYTSSIMYILSYLLQTFIVKYIFK